MKTTFRMGLAAMALLAGGSSHAVNPVQGWYLSLGGGASHITDLDFTFNNPVLGINDSAATLTYSLGGDAFGSLGYRWNKFRFEGELFFNYDQFDKIQSGTFVLRNHTTPNGFDMEGKTIIVGGLVNALYEMYQAGGDGSFVPYLGLGLGYGTVRSNFKLYNVNYNNSQVPIFESKESSSAAMAQGILGISYFLDDFAAFGLDFRYLATSRVDSLDASLRIPTVNVSFIYALDSSS
ncbi:outer membrane beta-barrel protein [Legionella sp. MW5194]|uniref:outer membrane beta-barrel protein n=1 Tax=Legionella sp. MW5194 TaxID=2662448 RepID=UPI00193CD2E4|nr:outer membrane beta-barrel protein [Legionella sp. MW5194]QRN03351.1 outer membrane beta-barrel protein [Legionella sp. MW5194]